MSHRLNLRACPALLGAETWSTSIATRRQISVMALRRLFDTVGMPLMYCYGRDCWSGIRGSTALAKLSHDREAHLQSQILELHGSQTRLLSDNEQLRVSNLALQLRLQRALQALKGSVSKQHDDVSILHSSSALHSKLRFTVLRDGVLQWTFATWLHSP